MAAAHNIPLVSLLALGQAESNWTRTAERWGDRTKVALWAIDTGDWAALEGIYEDIQQRIPNDISWGYGQISIGLAARYGLIATSGKATELLAVRAALFDGQRNLAIAAQHYRYTLDVALSIKFDLAGDDLLLAGLCIYNGGSVPGMASWYDQAYAANIRRYQECLAWAHAVVEV